MLEALKKFFGELGDKPEHQFEDNDYRLAAVALLVHAAAIDGYISDSEREKVNALVKQWFGLDETHAAELIAEATEAEQEAVDLYRFTSLLNRTLDDEGRRRVVEMLWQVAYADGQVSEFEDNLLWRASDLLSVPSHERIALRQRVAGDDDDSG
jgi:uncharacterized tellurite resistance protein B-like protein